MDVGHRLRQRRTKIKLWGYTTLTKVFIFCWSEERVLFVSRYAIQKEVKKTVKMFKVKRIFNFHGEEKKGEKVGEFHFCVPPPLERETKLSTCKKEERKSQIRVDGVGPLQPETSARTHAPEAKLR